MEIQSSCYQFQKLWYDFQARKFWWGHSLVSCPYVMYITFQTCVKSWSMIAEANNILIWDIPTALIYDLSFSIISKMFQDKSYLWLASSLAQFFRRTPLKITVFICCIGNRHSLSHSNFKASSSSIGPHTTWSSLPNLTYVDIISNGFLLQNDTGPNDGDQLTWYHLGWYIRLENPVLFLHR